MRVIEEPVFVCFVGVISGQHSHEIAVCVVIVDECVAVRVTRFPESRLAHLLSVIGIKADQFVLSGDAY